MKGKLSRMVTYEAEDTKKGMTALELLTALAQCPPDMVPKANIGLNGRIKEIKLEIEYRADQ